MKRFKSALFLATVASSAIITSVHAQELDGTGATSIQSVLVQELNCIDGNNQLGLATGALVTISEPTDLASGTFNCSTQSLLSGFSGKYVGTGSGFGRQAWRNVSNQFGGTNLNPHGTWNHVQFAFADSSIQVSDLTDYNTNNNVDSVAGLPIMFPKFVLPVAIAYSGKYGHRISDNKDLYFNVQSQQTSWGGIYLDVNLYCGIFNGGITNWNDTRFDALNSSTPLMDPSDSATRWTSDGVPIRLVGRMDKSGTTDIFTRALTAQCTGGTYTGPNYYGTNAEILPYNSSSGVSFVVERSDTGLKSGGGTAAGTTNRVGLEWFNPASGGSIQNSSQSVTNGATTSSKPDASTGNGSGFFLVANGSGAVAAAINWAPDFVTNNNADYQLNGKVGYIGADFIANSPTGVAGLFAASLKLNSTFVLPTAANASSAVATIRPPVSKSGTLTGAFDSTDEDRMVRNQTTGAQILASRDNPLAWYDVMYPLGFTNNASPSQTRNLAKPSAGYPITGTTQVLAYQCYTTANYPLMLNFLGYNVDKSLPGGFTGIFTNSSTGLLARSNIAAMPTIWKNAINETFLTVNSSQTDPKTGAKLGSLDLWIRDNCAAGMGM